MNDQKHMPKVSICIPTYNGAKYIEEALHSAINQTYSNIEIVICDDKSSDDTINICKAYQKKHPNIKIFQNTENLGLVKNWINVIDKASSYWIKFLFQDDVLKENCVKVMMNAALENNVNFVFCNRTYFFNGDITKKLKKRYGKVEKTENIFPSNTVITPIKAAQLIDKKIFNNCIGEPPCYLFNKSVIDANSFPLEYKQLIDYIFVLNIIAKHNFIFIKKSLVNFRVHLFSESLTTVVRPDSFDKIIYVNYYERLLLCHDLIYNSKFKIFKEEVNLNIIEVVRDWTTLKSFKRLGHKKAKEFYNKQNIKNFIYNKTTKNYSLLKYKYFKIKTKYIRKTYKV
ncbi:MAG: glycosyltransferase [Bacteroidetes bacterium]|jgi:glycosyltransferase involved in cell wall biosynthesis|nr:glycosyltransferase [Bacteroidota bacterium]